MFAFKRGERDPPPLGVCGVWRQERRSLRATGCTQSEFAAHYPTLIRIHDPESGDLVHLMAN
ncbi:hypothetical protein GCM10010273_43470 [Streptomyces lavendulocolor]